MTSVRSSASSSGRALSVLVNDLLFIARQGRRRAPQHEPIDLGELLEKVCGDAKVIAHGRDVDATTSMARTMLSRTRPGSGLFLVLLDDAMRCSKSREQSRWRSTAMTRGHGARLRSRHWHPGGGTRGDFRALPPRRKGFGHDEEGLGLGLPVARAIVRPVRKVEMASRPGEGTTVTVALPAARRRQRRERPSRRRRTARRRLHRPRTLTREITA